MNHAPNQSQMCASVILDRAISKPLTYLIPEEWQNQIQIGSLVEVPLKQSIAQGYVLEINHVTPIDSLKAICRILFELPALTNEMYTLAQWMSRYYHTPLFKVLKTFIPSCIRKTTKPKLQYFIKRKKTKQFLLELSDALQSKHKEQAKVLHTLIHCPKVITLQELMQKAKVSKSPIQSLIHKGVIDAELVETESNTLFSLEYFPSKPKTMNEEQKKALDAISSSLREKKFQPHLLYGVTGSGKTEVYLQAIKTALQNNYSVIVLVPEISLTPQTLDRFRSRFQQPIAVLHHRLTDKERFNEWKKIREGKTSIIIGARSAIFAPAQNLGLIIVDEEHEGSYKQTDDRPCYNARDVAVMRAKLNSCPVVLGTATPSLESYFNAIHHKYQLNVLSARAEKNSNLPVIELIDMNQEFQKAQGFSIFSHQLIQSIKEKISLGEQIILFLNRRGYFTSCICKTCSHVMGCPHCDLSLTYHLSDQELSCHLCGYSSKTPSKCPQCASSTIKYQGIGTEQVENKLRYLLPGVKAVRIDADTTRYKGELEKRIREFKTGKADVLIGTQMIAKGLHFPQVTLVGIINIDASLMIPDFRASEHVFQLITQVAGRAGRGHRLGRVLIQTYSQDNPTLQLAKNQNFEQFFSEEIQHRKTFAFPPYTHLVKVIFSGENKEEVYTLAKKFETTMKHFLPSLYEILAIVPSGRAKVKDKYRFQCIIKGPSCMVINQSIDQSFKNLACPKGVLVFIDVDPLSTFF